MKKSLITLGGILILSLGFISFSTILAEDPEVRTGEDLPLEGSPTAEELAAAILTTSTVPLLVSAEKTGVAGQFEVYTASLQGFPTDGSSWALISTGRATSIAGTAMTFYSYATYGPSTPGWSNRGLSSYDIATLTLRLSVPPGANTLSFDWKFGTEENPTWTWSYRDTAKAIVTTSAGSTNILLLPNGNPVDVGTASLFSNPVGGSSGWPFPPYPNPNDTIYNAITGWNGTANREIYKAEIDISAFQGEIITISFQIGDEKDRILDSALFIDNLNIDVDVILDTIPPVAVAGPDQTVNEGDLVTFDGSASSDNVGIVSYSWDFDLTDGIQEDAIGSIVTHTYGDDGIYIVTLTVKDAVGNSDTDTLTVTALNLPPIVEAGPDQTVNEGEIVSFSGSFTDPGWLDTHTIVWEFGDGNSAIETLTPIHTYGDNGIYTVTLTVTDDDNGIGTDTLIVTALNVAPIVTIDVIEQPNPHFILPVVHPLTFTGSFTDLGWLDTHTATWDFGDGTVIGGVLTEENEPPEATGVTTATHTYSEPGIYTVTLTITDDDGDIGIATTTVKVMTAEEAKEIINSYIQDLPDEAFDARPVNQRKNAFNNKFRAVDEMLKVENYRGAIQKLQNDIRAKADGFIDGNPKNDWIIDPQAQQEICKMIDDLIAYLQILL